MDEEKLGDFIRKFLNISFIADDEFADRKLKFKEIEGMGFYLPPSAKRLPKWWRRFLNSQWSVEIDRENETIRFLRGKAKFTTTPRIRDQKNKRIEPDKDKEQFGKRLCILAGIITIIGLYVLQWGYQEVSLFGETFDVYYYGIAGVLNIPSLISIGTALSFFTLIMVILTLMSGFIILIGVVKPIAALIGAIFPLIISFTLLLLSLGVPTPGFMGGFWFAFSSSQQYISGVFPFGFRSTAISFGPVFLFVGGLVSVIGGINELQSKRSSLKKR